MEMRPAQNKPIQEAAHDSGVIYCTRGETPRSNESNPKDWDNLKRRDAKVLKIGRMERKTKDERIRCQSVRPSSFVKFMQSKNSKIVYGVGLLADNSKSSLWASRLGWNSPSVGLGSGQLGKLVPRMRSKTGVGWGCDDDDRHLPCTLGVWRGETRLLRRAGRRLRLWLGGTSGGRQNQQGSRDTCQNAKDYPHGHTHSIGAQDTARTPSRKADKDQQCDNRQTFHILAPSSVTLLRPKSRSNNER